MQTKVPFYNILNMLLTGLIFVGASAIIFPDKALVIVKSEIISSLGTTSEVIFAMCFIAITYEIGLIINRIGSIGTETLLKRLKLIPFDDDYKRFNEAKKEHPILETLSREYALSRTSLTLYILIFIISLTGGNDVVTGVSLIVCIIFGLSTRKHASKIVELMKRK